MINAQSDCGSRLAGYSLPIILAAFMVLAAVYSLATPIFEGPDEIWHFAFADHLANGGGLPVFDVNQPATFLRDGAHPPLYYWLVAAVLAPIDRSDFPNQFHFDLASPKITPGGQSDRPNLLIHTAREDFPYHSTALAAHLARLVSIALGLITISGVWKVAHRLLPDRDRLAIAATALAAFVPQFVYGSAMINNDALAAATGTWTLLALLRLMHDRSLRWAIVSGLLVGITLLSKIGMIAILPLPAIALLLADFNYRDTEPQKKLNVLDRLKAVQWKSAIVSGLIIYFVAFVIAGWWYLRNWSLYGDPLAWKQWQVLAGLGRVPPTFGDFMHDMIGLFGTFWADFSLRVDRTWWWVIGLLVLLALGGLARRALRRDWPSIDWAGALMAVTWLGLLLVLLIRYSFTVYDVAGRALYPALVTISVVLVIGLSGWNEIIGRRLIFGTIGALVAVNLIAPPGIIVPAYAPPLITALPQGAKLVNMPFDESDVVLIGYQILDDQVKSGEPITVDTYWQSKTHGRIIPGDANRAVASGGIALIRRDGAGLGHTANVLGTNVYPNWAWRSDDIVSTRFVIRTEAEASSIADVRLQVSAPEPARDPFSFILGRVVIRADRSCRADQSADVTFGGSIKLIGHSLKPHSVLLCWKSTQLTNIDYTVFVHALNDNGDSVIGDSPPHNGMYPTSVWLVGEEIEDEHALNVTPRPKNVRVGLYRLDTGERLTIDGTNETEFVLTTP